MRNALISGARWARDIMRYGLRALGGFERVAESQWRRQRLLILCYHGVSIEDEHEWDPELFVSPGFLRRRFEILRDRSYTVLPLGEAVRMLHLGKLPPRSVALTFDDGFFNFLSSAVPVLEEFGYPATNYVSTYFCSHQRPLPHLMIRYLVWRGRNEVLPAGFFPGQVNPVALSEQHVRDTVFPKMLRKFDDLAGDRRAQESWMMEISEAMGISGEEVIGKRLFHLMTREELRQAARRGFDIQLHTHRHRVPREKEKFFAEIRENREVLEPLTESPTRHFCYPSGEVDAQFLPWLRELGVESATTGVPGLASPTDDLLLLPRYIDTMMQSELTFESWLSGVSSRLS